MNWYKTAQQEQWSWPKFLAYFGVTVIGGLAAMKGVEALDIQKELVANPQKVVQEAEVVKEQQEQQIQQPQQEEITFPAQTGDIDLDKIWAIESSKGTDPKMGRSSAGARGHYQFMEDTWNEMVQKMGVDWDWANGSMDYKKSTQVADYYFNTEIPRLLNAFKIPDNIETRIGAYNWGVGHLNREGWGRYGENWLKHSPKDTIDYVTKYRGV